MAKVEEEAGIWNGLLYAFMGAVTGPMMAGGRSHCP
jgi:hypothetical protein